MIQHLLGRLRKVSLCGVEGLCNAVRLGTYQYHVVV